MRQAFAADIEALLAFLDQAAGIAEAWVLTETAGAFFVSRGYRDEPRSSLPPTLTGRSVLAEVCPCSCRCLRKSLGPEKTSPS